MHLMLLLHFGVVVIIDDVTIATTGGIFLIMVDTKAGVEFDATGKDFGLIILTNFVAVAFVDVKEGVLCIVSLCCDVAVLILKTLIAMIRMLIIGHIF